MGSSSAESSVSVIERMNRMDARAVTRDPGTRLAVDLWADVLCPWCYIGEQRLDTAIEQAAHGDDVELRLHTFQLNPSAPDEPRPALDHLAEKYGITRARAEAMERTAAQQARAEGLPYEVDRRVGNTFPTLRLVHLAGEHGVAWEFLQAVQREAFSGNPRAFEHDTLVEIGVALGVPEVELRGVLASDRYADAVRADHQRAVALGATGVPFAVLGGRVGIRGAVSTEQYAAAIDQVWEQVHGES
jgi:predicted DsbA family dithiol-disulfide isomerase